MRRARLALILCLVFGAVGLGGVLRADTILFVGAPGGSSSGSWASWDESSEDGWGDSEHVNICFYDNPLVGNEISVGGGLTGADLVFTQYGDVAGAVGGMRTLDDTDDYFGVEIAFLNKFIGNGNAAGTWSVIIKLNSITGTNYHGPFLWTAAGRNFEMSVHATGVLVLETTTAAGGSNFQTVGTVPGGTTVWICAWADGVNNTRIGFSTTKPSKWSDFAANNRAEGTTKGNYSDTSFSDAHFILKGSGGFFNAKTIYQVTANICLIDND